MSSSPGNAKATAPIPSSKPVDILQSQLSLLYANLHPILLLSILLVSFRSLVEDPVNTLLGLAPTVAILQALYCVLCLPSTGQTPAPAPKPGQKKKAAKPAQDIWAKIVVRHLKKTGVDYELMKCVAGLPLPSPYDLPLSAGAVHHRRPLRRTAHNAPTSYAPSCAASRSSDYTATLLRAWIRDANMAEDSQLTTACG